MKILIEAMHIDSYEFGRVVVDGVAYTKDCLIIGGAVKANWWRQEGHSLAVEDLQDVIEAKPAVLVVGCGASGQMEIPESTRQVLKDKGIQLEACYTGEAVRKINELMKNEANLAAALHLTC